MEALLLFESYMLGPPIVEFDGFAPFIVAGTIISKLSSCGFRYLIPLPFKDANGPRLLVFLWLVVGGS